MEYVCLGSAHDSMLIEICHLSSEDLGMCNAVVRGKDPY